MNATLTAVQALVERRIDLLSAAIDAHPVRTERDNARACLLDAVTTEAAGKLDDAERWVIASLTWVNKGAQHLFGLDGRLYPAGW